MKYILPLEKEREKYHFEISNDGKELKKSNIIPVVNDNKQDLQNGVVYVESPFQKDEYFDITKFNQQSQDKWREIIRELSSKIGATKIKTTLLLEKEDSINSDENNEFTAKVSGNYKIVDGDASINNTNSSKKGHNEQLSSSLEFELELNGKKQSIEEVEKWIEDNKINKDKNLIFRMLLDQFKNNNLVKYEEIQKIEQIINVWSEEAKEVYYIEQVEKELNFKAFEQSFPLARSMKRKFSIFVGKTNSGKTFAAMNALAQGESGVYLAPLRLMAQEGQDALFDRKVLANLVTGEEKKQFDGATHVSSTVEMCNMTRPVDVAVIDEIQMIADESRGWAWSQALVGVPAKHVVLVGSEEALPFILPIIDSLGEEYEVTKFERKTPLHIHDGLKKFKELKAGDCVVVFSRKNALEMKNAIEASGKKCSVIYGNLSPDVRRSEANKFKSGENPILVATDAIGMGLNLPMCQKVGSPINTILKKPKQLLRPYFIMRNTGRVSHSG